MSVTIYDYPYSPSSGAPITIAGTQVGIAVNVAADGSALTAVNFPTAYATAVNYVGATIDESTNIGTYELTVQVSSVGLTGFNLYVAGGLAGSTVSVYWQAVGS